MKKLFFILSFVNCTYSNGQVKTNLPKGDTVIPKMIRTQGLVSGNVLCKLQDKFGNLWFCTSGEGVYMYDGKRFKNFTTKDGLSSNDVNAVIEDKAGNILFGTKNGICKYSPIASLKAGEKPISTFTENLDDSKKPISSMLEDKKGNLWFGTWTAGIYRYTPSNLLKAGEKNFTNFLNKDDYHFNLGNHNQLILDILEDKNGNLWFSSWNGGGVWKYNPSLRGGEKSFKNFLPSAEYYKNNQDERTNNKQGTYLTNFLYAQTSDNITDDMIFSMTEDKAGNIWFATRRHGVCRYDPTASLRAGAKSFTSFREPEGFISRAIYDIMIDRKGNIWLTTDANGVFRYDGKIFKNFTTKDGLINDSVFSVLEDKNGNIWFGTRSFGLSRYDPSANTDGKMFTNFSE